MFTPIFLGKWIQFDGHMFQRGWFNHQLVEIFNAPRKINMIPENTPLENENHLPNHHFQGLQLYVFSALLLESLRLVIAIGFPCNWRLEEMGNK